MGLLESQLSSQFSPVSQLSAEILAISQLTVKNTSPILSYQLRNISSLSKQLKVWQNVNYQLTPSIPSIKKIGHAEYRLFHKELLSACLY